ncbi:MAG TPA: UvrD-helicase domain-containing protein [Planctomycetota bacterium]
MVNAAPSDQAERDKALQSSKNLAVTAGAGTGKTTLLVSKILRKVLEEGVAVDRLLALTFTEKAANELKGRVRDKLREVGKEEGLEKAEIGTIHSFCAHVLRRYPIEAGVRPDFEVDEGEAFRRLFARAWAGFLDAELGTSARRPRVWQELLRTTDLKTLGELAEGLCGFGVPEPRGDGAETLARFAKAAAALAPDLADALAGDAEPPKKPKSPTPAWSSALKLAQDRLKIDDRWVGKALELLGGFAEEFRRDYVARGWISFEGMIGLVRDLLNNPAFPEPLERLRARYDYILVDEFQDTDPVQGEIIQKLAEGRNGKLVPGRLFIVGDPKQSIYSFRGADIMAYQKLVDRILAEGGERAVLSTNFRSHGKILDFVNAVFEKAIVENGPLQPAYEPIRPKADAKPRLPGPSLEAILIEDATADEARESEGEAIADWIAARKGFSFRDVAILFKALTDAEVYLEALRARDIPYVVQGEKYFYGTTEVVDFVNLLGAVADPHDKIALAGVLRSPYGALKDQELYELRKSLDYRIASDVPIFAFLKRWNALAGTLGVAELIDRIFEEGWALEIAQAGYHGEQAAANVLKLRQKATELEAKGGLTLREFLDIARKAVRDREEEGESPLADESLDAVTVLSIHRSKGLEYPVVILPDLHRASQTRQDPVLRVNWPTRTVGVRLGEVIDSGGAALAWLDRERRREEEKRLLYVATTRAREKLVLLGGAAKSGTYLSTLLPEIEKRAEVTRKPHKAPAFRRASTSPEGERPDWDAFVKRWKSREAKAEAAAPPLTTPSKAEGPAAAETRGTSIGTLCHRVMEGLDFQAPRVPEGTDPEAAAILEKFFKSAAFKELAGAEILARELPFVVPRDGTMLEGVIDVVYRRGKKLYVGDYKTDKVMKPEAHALIRDVYADAARRALGEPPTFKLIYLRQGKAVEL